MTDAIVVGAGPNGLVAANMLVDAGWRVTVLEAAAEPGGAVRSGELIEPGFTHDLFSAFYPLAVASPILKGFYLERYGLTWTRAPVVLAHPRTNGDCPALHMDLEATMAALDACSEGDGAAWARLYELWQRIGHDVIDALFTPFPPVAAGAKMVARLGIKDLARFGRFSVLPIRRLAEEEFSGPNGALLLAGNALHSDLAPESPLSGFFGWLLMSLGQEVGFPAPEGGAGKLIGALVRRFVERGGEIHCNERVTRVEVRGGRAAGITTATGASVGAERAVLADVGAPALYLDLVDRKELPTRVFDDIQRFHYDNATVKIDWALDGPIPWKSDEARLAGTVHVADDMDAFTLLSAQLSMGQIPADPFLVMGQMTTTDPTRSPPGTETAWAYTHVPQRVRGDAGGDLTGSWDERETETFAQRMEDKIETLAPGFRDVVRGRHVMTPRTMQDADRNLVNGAINGGTAQLHQQLVFRPTPGLGRPETPVKDLYLASSSAHPGGGVHGAPGANAAKAALWGWRRRRLMLKS
ncbi:MAG: phytoene desaturase family protein [Actinomycetota bacterium]